MARAIKIRVDQAAGLQLNSIESSLRVLDKAALKEFKTEVSDDFIDPLTRYMRAAAVAGGRHGPRLARTVKARTGARLAIGSTREPTWAGAEFGGRALRKRATLRRKSNGGYTVVYRRTTMQFLPHKGREGYYVFAAWRKHGKELTARLLRTMDNFVNRFTDGGV